MLSIMSVCLSNCPSVCLSEDYDLEMIAKSVGFYSLRNIPTGSMVVLSYFLGGKNPHSRRLRGRSR